MSCFPNELKWERFNVWYMSNNWIYILNHSRNNFQFKSRTNIFSTKYDFGFKKRSTTLKFLRITQKCFLRLHSSLTNIFTWFAHTRHTIYNLHFKTIWKQFLVKFKKNTFFFKKFVFAFQKQSTTLGSCNYFKRVSSAT